MNWMDEIAQLTAAMPPLQGELDPLSFEECVRACVVCMEFNRMAHDHEAQARLTPEEKHEQAVNFNWLINEGMLRAMMELMQLRRKGQEDA